MLIQSKFKELDTFLIKKMMKTIGEFSSETRMRLETIERQNNESQDDFKKDIMSKLAQMTAKLN
jgi:hypothetical protein